MYRENKTINSSSFFKRKTSTIILVRSSKRKKVERLLICFNIYLDNGQKKNNELYVGQKIMITVYAFLQN
jgi:hypothetical protein